MEMIPQKKSPADQDASIHPQPGILGKHQNFTLYYGETVRNLHSCYNIPSSAFAPKVQAEQRVT